METVRIPKHIQAPLKKWNALLAGTSALLLVGWYVALFVIKADADMGDIYRIIYLHVPCAFSGFIWIITSAWFAIRVLMSKGESGEFWEQRTQAAMELSLIFSFLTLLTGSIWGRPTWGVWWDWDPRLTSSLVMFLLCCGFFLLRAFTPSHRDRRTVSAVVALLAALNVPIVYFSVNLWRSLHQQQTFMRKQNNASSDVALLLMWNLVALVLVGISIYKTRRQGIRAQEQLEKSRAAQLGA